MLRRQVSTSAQPGTGRPSGKRGTGQAGHRIFGSRTSPAESGTFGQARCHRLRRSFGFGGVGQDRVSARELRTRHGPRASAHDHARRNRGFGRGSRRTRMQSFGSGGAEGREAGLTFQIRRAANWQGFGPVGEPPGDTRRASARTDSGGCGARTCPGYRASKPPIATGPFRRISNEGTVGPGSDAGPHYCLGEVGAAKALFPSFPRTRESLCLSRHLFALSEHGEEQRDSRFRGNDASVVGHPLWPTPS